VAYVVGFGYFRQRFPVTLPGQSFVTLMFGELELPSELYPVGPCTLPAFIGPRQDQMPLKLRQPAQHRNHQLAVGPSLCRPKDHRMSGRTYKDAIRGGVGVPRGVAIANR